MKYLFLICSSPGEFAAAADHFEAFYELTSSKDWSTEDSSALHSQSCEHLRRLYTTMADTYQREPKLDLQEAITYLLKALEMAKESKFVIYMFISFLMYDCQYCSDFFRNICS